MHGVLLVNKPPVITSHDVVAAVRKQFHIRKVGHAGTLDPFATGLLLLCLGDATKIVRYLSDCEKEYLAVMKVGEETDTQDLTGQIVRQTPVPDLSHADITRVFAQFHGDLLQTPPMYSARRVQGKRLYELARQGKTVERQAQPVHIARLTILDISLPFIRFQVVCSKGTYVRTLAHDIGKILECGAHLTELERTRIGEFRLADAYLLEHLSERKHVPGTLIPLDKSLSFFPEVILQEAESKQLMHGVQIYERITSDTIAEKRPEAETHMVRGVRFFRNVYRPGSKDSYSAGRWIVSTISTSTGLCQRNGETLVNRANNSIESQKNTKKSFFSLQLHVF